MIRESLRVVASNTLRRDLSDILNRAAYGDAPVVVTRRGLKIAAIISQRDLVFLMNMKEKRDELRSRPMPSDLEEVGPELARRLREEVFFG